MRCLIARAPRFTRLRQLTERTLPIGSAGSSVAVDLFKRIRLANLLALWACAIMAPWTAIEALFGDAANLPWEIAFLTSFVLVLTLNAAGADRASRLLLIATANVCVFVGALMFDESAGGILPFFPLVALPLLLFGPGERAMVAVGVALPALLFAACQTGAAARLLSIQSKPAPGWYFTANVVSAFAVAFVIPFFFYRSNLKAEATLEQIGREKLKRVIDSTLIGVVRGRLSGRIEEANDTFLALLGYTRQDLERGALDLKLIAPLDAIHTGGARALAEMPWRGVSSVYERTCFRKDGTAIPALIGVAPLDDSHDEVVGFVLDLSAQKHVEEQDAMLRDSHEALRLRDLFNSIASHELKTPLTALMLNLKTLRRRLGNGTPASAALHLQVERCESSAARMGELIHRLLDVAQVHDGKLKLTLHEMDVVDAVQRIVGAFETTGLSQKIVVQAERSVTARLDSLRFDQVLTNLLSNAIKYGAGQPIEVRVRQDGVADAARVEVIDHGPGIDPSMMQKIFEPFQRAVAPDEHIPGLGLGLYVVKMIVEGHGGRINVESVMGQGSRFIVELPRAAPPLSSLQTAERG